MAAVAVAAAVVVVTLEVVGWAAGVEAAARAVVAVVVVAMKAAGLAVESGLFAGTVAEAAEVKAKVAEVRAHVAEAVAEVTETTAAAAEMPAGSPLPQHCSTRPDASTVPASASILLLACRRSKRRSCRSSTYHRQGRRLRQGTRSLCPTRQQDLCLSQRCSSVCTAPAQVVEARASEAVTEAATESATEAATEVALWHIARGSRQEAWRRQPARGNLHTPQSVALCWAIPRGLCLLETNNTNRRSKLGFSHRHMKMCMHM